MCIPIPWRKHMQNFIRIGTKLKRGCTHKRYPVFTYCGWKIKITMWKKWQKNDLTIISKPYTQPHTMKWIHAKFQTDQYKTVRTVTLMRYPLSIYWGWKMTKVQMWQKWSNNYIQIKCTSSYHEKNTCKVSKWSVQNCEKSCAHKTPRNGWTNRWKLERLSHPC